MAEAKLIDGKAYAAGLRQRVAAGVAALIANDGPKPGLATVLIGDDQASQVYVRSKGKLAAELGMASFDHRLPAETTEAKLMALIAKLNADKACTASWCSCRCPSTSIPRTCCWRSIRPRTSTAFIP